MGMDMQLHRFRMNIFRVQIENGVCIERNRENQIWLNKITIL